MVPSAPLALVYAGRGASPRCVAALLACVRIIGARFAVQVRRVGAAELACGHWRERSRLLCMPGGRDLPYVRDLRGAAMRHIAAFVASGGSYFGSCAGAYVACDALRFEAARVPAVRGPRPLRLLSAVAHGPSQAADQFTYGAGPQAGLRALRLTASASLRGRAAMDWRVVNQGGCVLLPHHGRAWRRHERVLLHTQQLDASVAPAARHQAVAVLSTHRRGRVLLCGAHPELTDTLQVVHDGPGAPPARRGVAALADLLAQLLMHGGGPPRPTGVLSRPPNWISSAPCCG